MYPQDTLYICAHTTVLHVILISPPPSPSSKLPRGREGTPPWAAANLVGMFGNNQLDRTIYISIQNGDFMGLNQQPWGYGEIYYVYCVYICVYIYIYSYVYIYIYILISIYIYIPLQ